MNFEEHAAKPLLAKADIPVPESALASSAVEAGEIAAKLGAVVVKAQVPTGKRGKAGGIKVADSREEAQAAAETILGMSIAGHKVEKVLVEGRSNIAREFYAAVLNDPASRGPLVIFSTEGGMDIEEVAASNPAAIRKAAIDIEEGFEQGAARLLVQGLDLGDGAEAVSQTLAKLYGAYRNLDAELLEINPLVLTAENKVVALDCKFTLDDGALGRQGELAGAVHRSQ